MRARHSNSLAVTASADLRQRMANLNDSVSLLREDRELLNRDVLTEREKTQKLAEENEHLKILNDELMKQQKTLQEQISKMSQSQLR